MFSPCILLIDDDVRLLVKLEAALRRAGYRVLMAQDGRQGAYLADAAHPEVIVCDVSMPSFNDFDVRSTAAFIPLTMDRHELVARVNAAIRSHAVH